MSHIKHKKHILATIRDLRVRKSRPDVERICKHMLKRYKVAPRETRADLRRCVANDIVVKVDYKDNVSYRDAAEWRSEKKRVEEKKQMSNMRDSSERRLITSAVAELIYQEESCIERGVSFNELVKAAASKAAKFSKRHLETIVQREIQAGTLVRLPNGNLALGPSDNDADSSDSTKEEYNPESNRKQSPTNSSGDSSPMRFRRKTKTRSNTQPTSSATTRSVRVGERRKMAKKVFDPSDNNLPVKRVGNGKRPQRSNVGKTTSKRNRSDSKRDNTSTTRSESQVSDGSQEEMEPDEISNVSEEAGGVCSVCLVQKSRGSDRLVECRDCSNKAHTSCLQSGSGMLKLRPDNTWQCPHCKICVICCETNDAGILTVCSICSDAYHALCHSPRIPDRLKAWNQWECINCQKCRMGEPSSHPIIQQSPPPKGSPPSPDPFLKAHEQDLAKSKLDAPIDTNIPDIKDWTSDNVYKYFLEHLPEVAHVFKEQEMDGQALGLACRKDIVRGLGLQLGPALRLYRIVVKLQSRKDDVTMCWG